MRRVKFYFVVLAVLVVLISSGCGLSKNQNLVCKQTASGVDIQFNVGFKGNMVSSMDFSYDMDLSSYSDLQINAIKGQDFCNVVKSSMSEYSNAFTNCNQNIEDKHLKVSAAFDVNKITKNVLDKFTSPKATKTELEKQGYVCEFK